MGVRYKSDEKELFKVGMYLRLSQEDKFKKNVESNSIDNQRKIIKDYIDKSDDLVYIEEYADDGFTGTNFDRPSFQRMLEDIKNKKINTIIVKDLSRFGRNYIEVGKFLEDTFPTMRIRFISIIDGIDSYENPDSSSSMLVNFKNLINDEYSRDISRKVKIVYQTKQKKGEYIAASVPYGYIRDPDDNHHLIIDKEASDVVKLIFNLALSNYTAFNIAEYLNERGIMTTVKYKKEKGMKYKTGIVNEANIDNFKWTADLINSILQNEVYTGTTIQNKKNKVSYKIKKNLPVEKTKWIKVENTHEAIISKEDFDFIQEKYFSKIIHVRNNYEYALFAGFLICSDCSRGFAFCHKTRKDGSIYNFYQCGYYKLNKNNCTSHTISEEKLKNIVIKSINKHIKLVQRTKEKINIIKNNKNDSIKIEVLKNRKEEIDNEIDKNMKIKQSLYTDWKEDIITFDDYKNYSSSYNTKIEELKEMLNTINNEITEYETIPDNNDELNNIFNESNLINELDRNILFRMIEQIIIYEDKKVEISFKYQDIYNDIRKYINSNKKLLK